MKRLDVAANNEVVLGLAARVAFRANIVEAVCLYDDMPMRSPESQFDERLLRKAEVLTGGDRHSAVRLCRLALERCNGQGSREVFLALAEIHYERNEEEDWPEPLAEILACELGWTRIHAESQWLANDDLLVALYEPLLHIFPLRRIICALRILGWDYDSIGDLIAAGVDVVSKASAPAPGFLEVEEDLTRWRTAIGDRFASDDNSEWLRSLMANSDNLELEFKTWSTLKKMCDRPPGQLFCRPGADQNGWLRDQWSESKKILKRRITVDDLFRPVTK